MTFDADAYWQAGGPYIATEAVSPEHILAEERLAVLLLGLGDVDSVLDVGCGQGRVAALLKRVVPDAYYFGVDLGTSQVEATAHIRPDGTVYQSRLQDFVPDDQWDVVVCSEVLMHVPPADMPGVAEMLLKATRRFLVLIEWVPDPWELEQPIAPWNWPHDYEALLGPFDSVERIYRQNLMLRRM